MNWFINSINDSYWRKTACLISSNHLDLYQIIASFILFIIFLKKFTFASTRFASLIRQLATSLRVLAAIWLGASVTKLKLFGLRIARHRNLKNMNPLQPNQRIILIITMIHEKHIIHQIQSFSFLYLRFNIYLTTLVLTRGSSLHLLLTFFCKHPQIYRSTLKEVFPTYLYPAFYTTTQFCFPQFVIFSGSFRYQYF